MGATPMKRAFLVQLVRGVTAAAIVLAPACASPGGSSPGRQASIGCYQFAADADAQALGLPWGFDLLGDSIEGWPNVPDGRVALTRLTESQSTDHPFAFWQMLDGDSILVGHPGGGGLSLRLGPSGQDLAGWGRAVGDVVRLGEPFAPRAPRPVIARRVLCPEAR